MIDIIHDSPANYRMYTEGIMRTYGIPSRNMADLGAIVTHMGCSLETSVIVYIQCLSIMICTTISFTCI
jgi:hypothetical protein